MTTEDETLGGDLGVIPNTVLTGLDTVIKTFTSCIINIGLDLTHLVFADVVSRTSEITRLDLKSLSNHDNGQIDNTCDSQEGGVTQGSDLLLKGDGNNNKDSHENEDELTANDPVHTCCQATLKHVRHTNMQFICNNNGITNTCTEGI